MTIATSPDTHQVFSKCQARSKGEHSFARQVEAFGCPTFRLSFSIGFMPGVREIDLLLADTELGCYIVEVKAISLEMIQSISPNDWRIQGRASTESPLQQAYAQYEGLEQFWVTRMRTRLPFIAITACFPNISRHEWQQAFAQCSYAACIEQGLIFREDLVDLESFRARLACIMRAPAIRTGRKPYRLDARFTTELQQFLGSAQPDLPTANDRQRLKAIEKGINAGLEAEFPVAGAHYAMFSGHPGTGKTFRLLSIGLMHALRQRPVLFACFNKTLASDIRRLLGFSDSLNASGRMLACADVFQLAVSIHKMNRLPYLQGVSPDDWGASVVAYLRRNPNALMGKYETLLVDESHDMQEWQLELLELHLKPQGSVYMAMGPGQALYRADTGALAWLKGISQDRPVKEKRLRRNFRNTPLQYCAALAFHQAWPDRLPQVAKSFETVTRPMSRNQEFEFERNGSAIRYMPVPALAHEFEDQGVMQQELVAGVYAGLIRAEIEQMREGQNMAPVNLLVLVPSEGGAQVHWVRQALKNVAKDCPEVSFIDYVDEKNRRTPALNHEIRFSTFHSSRGLEGEHVLIFGLEEIEQVALQAQAKPENLAFICLSRGIFKTTVVVRNYYNNAVHRLMQEIVAVGSAMS